MIYLYGHVRNFSVAETPGGEISACCALAPVWEDLGEICSLVVRDDLRRQGLGRRMVAACLEECRELHLKKIFALTYQDKSVLPQKIWVDCAHCAKYPDCDETAVFLDVPGTLETATGK